ncbi:unnamed protein product, partial [Didymodactylos carnosus]
PSSDDVDVLKHELVSVQQQMNDLALEKENEISKLIQELSTYKSTISDRDNHVKLYKTFFDEMNEYSKQLDQFQFQFNESEKQSEELNTYCTNMKNDTNNLIQLIQFMKEKFLLNKTKLNNRIDQYETNFTQLHMLISRNRIDDHQLTLENMIDNMKNSVQQV